MQHLHGASSRSRFPVPVLCFLVLWSVTAVPVTKKAHGSTTECQRGCLWGGSGRKMQPEAIQRHLCLLWRAGDCPALGLGAICSSMQKLPTFWCKMTSRLFLEMQRGCSMWAGTPKLGSGQWRRERFDGPPPSPGQHCTHPTPRCPTCDFTGIPGCILMNSVIVTMWTTTSSCNDTSFCFGENSQVGWGTHLSVLHKFNSNNKKVSLNWKKRLSNTGNK